MFINIVSLISFYHHYLRTENLKLQIYPVNILIISNWCDWYSLVLFMSDRSWDKTHKKPRVALYELGLRLGTWLPQRRTVSFITSQKSIWQAFLLFVSLLTPRILNDGLWDLSLHGFKFHPSILGGARKWAWQNKVLKNRCYKYSRKFRAILDPQCQQIKLEKIDMWLKVGNAELDQLPNLGSPLQHDNVGPLAQKLSRISGRGQAQH